jgi:hypothetical protein
VILLVRIEDIAYMGDGCGDEGVGVHSARVVINNLAHVLCVLQRGHVTSLVRVGGVACAGDRCGGR